MRRFARLQGILLLSILGALALSSCGGLGGEPEIVSTLVPPPTEQAFAVLSNHPGATIYADRCASCHGEQGRGDGPVTRDAGVPVPDFTDPNTQAQLTFAEWEEVIRKGRINEGKLMPPWEGALTDQQIQDVAEFTYSLADGQTVAQTSGAESTAEATGEAVASANVLMEATGAISREVTNGSPGGTIAEGMTAELNILDQNLQVIDTITAPVENGAYRFENVPIRHDQAYIVRTEYDNGAFYSELSVGTPQEPEMSLPLAVYDYTDDPNVVQISLLLTRITQYSDALVFEHVVTFENFSDHAYRTAEQVDTDAFASVDVYIPAEAQVLNTADLEGRFVYNTDGVTGQTRIVDTEPVVPNAPHTVQVFYMIPRTTSEQSFDIAMPIEYTMANQAELMVRPGGMTIESDQFQDQGVQEFTSGMYYSFLAESVPTGQTLAYTVNVSDVETTQATPEEDDQPLALILLLSGAGLMVLSAVLWVVNRRRQTPEAV